MTRFATGYPKRDDSPPISRGHTQTSWPNRPHDATHKAPRTRARRRQARYDGLAGAREMSDWRAAHLLAAIAAAATLARYFGRHYNVVSCRWR